MDRFLPWRLSGTDVGLEYRGGSIRWLVERCIGFLVVR